MAAMKCFRGHLREVGSKGMLRQRSKRIHLHCRQAANARRQWHAACKACQKRKRRPSPSPPPRPCREEYKTKNIHIHIHWKKENIHTRAEVMPSCFVRAWHSRRPAHALRVAPGICQIPKPCLNRNKGGGYIHCFDWSFECLVAL